MKTEIFNASVQYNHLLGTSAADYSDDESLAIMLEGLENISNDESIVGIEMYTTDSYAPTDSYAHEDKPIWVTILIRNSVDESIRKYRVDMSGPEFFSCFKRFNVKFSRVGELTGSEVQISE